MRKERLLIKSFLTFFFLMATIVLSKIKLHPIFGTGGRFSLLAMFAPIIPSFIGASFGAIAIFGARLLQFFLGISHPKHYLSYISYLPVFIAGVFFSKMFKRKRDHLAIPIGLILLFILHPIGRQVWYFSLYWLIPIVIIIAQPYIRKIFWKHDLPTIYLYALSATFIDHAVGSVMYLYYFNIPAIYWIMAIPYVPIERAIFALGITSFYLFVKKALEALQRILPVKIMIIETTEEKIEEPVLLEAKVILS